MKSLKKSKGGNCQMRALFLVVCHFAFVLQSGWANPSGGVVTQGSANISGGAGNLTIQQSSDRAVINWQDFSIQSGELTQFIQPGSSSATLSRVIGANPSSIYGTLSANGQLYLVNPNGIMVGPTGVINAQSFIASTLDVTDSEFMAGGAMRFTGPSQAKVENFGTINALGGDVFLIGKEVVNAGTINAAGGTVGLAGGTDILLTPAGASGSKLAVAVASGSGSVTNSGTINAVSAELKAAGGNPYALAINNTGIIKATGVTQEGGRILLSANAGKVSNTGTLDASGTTGGSVKMTGQQVENGGTILAAGSAGKGGEVVLQSWVTGGTTENSGSIDASGTLGGTVHLLGESVNVRAGSLVQATGAQGGGEILVGGSWQNSDPSVAQSRKTTVEKGAVLDASATVNGKGGTVVAWSDVTDPNSVTVAQGTFLAKGGANGGNGGRVETSGYRVIIGDSASVNTLAPLGEAGVWLIDPTNFTVAASGGDMTGSTLGTNLGGGHVTIDSTLGSGTGGHVYINDTVTWNAATKLKLNAQNNIYVNSAITAQHANGQVSLEYGQGAVESGNTATYSIAAPINLQAGPNFFTKLGSDGAVETWKVITALGSEGSTTGTDLQGMDGNRSGKFVLGANIDAAATSGWNSSAGFLPVGDGGTQFTGKFDGLGHTISNLTITRSGMDYVGLFGYTYGASIANVGVVNANIRGNWYVGGLVGLNESSTVSNSYATGSVSGVSGVGGLVGLNFNSSTVSNSYATGSVSGTGSYVGGLVGYNSGSTVSNSYATGSVSVSGGGSVGGLVGYNSGSTVSNSYWDTATTGRATSAGGTGKTTAEMKQIATFSGWDISDAGGDGKVWRIYEGNSSPLLRSFLTAATLELSSGTTTSNVYDGDANINVGAATAVWKQSGSTFTPSGNLLGSLGIVVSDKNVGTNKTVTQTGFYSNQQGYDIVNGIQADITAKALSLAGLTASNKTYDATDAATISNWGTLIGVVGSETVTLNNGSASSVFADKNVGTGKLVTVGGLALSGGGAGNYSIGNPTTTADITAKALTITGSSAADKMYDGTTSAVVTSGTLSGFVGTETVTVGTATGIFADANVGVNKNVTASYGLSNGTNGGLAANYSLADETLIADITAVPSPVTSLVSTPAATGTISPGTMAPVVAGYPVINLGGQSVIAGSMGVVNPDGDANYLLTETFSGAPMDTGFQFSSLFTAPGGGRGGFGGGAGSSSGGTGGGMGSLGGTGFLGGMGGLGGMGSLGGFGGQGGGGLTFDSSMGLGGLGVGPILAYSSGFGYLSGSGGLGGGNNVGDNGVGNGRNGGNRQ